MKLIGIFLLCLLSFQNNAQQETWIEARGKAGFLVAHRSIMGHLAQEHAFATELSYMFRGNGEKAWHDRYNNPRYGISAFYGSVGSVELMGRYVGLYTFMSIPIIKTKHYSFSGRFGCGVGYANKVYDSENNIFSIGVSTHFNALVSLAVENRFEFGRHSINTIFDMTHFSNGAMKVPNLGLNLPFLSLGYGYMIKEKAKDSIYTYEPFRKYWEFGGVAFGSVKEIFPTEGRKYPVYGVNAVARRYFSRSAGMEFSFDYIHKQAVLGYHADVPKTQAEIIQLGVFAGYLMPLNHFHLVVGMGYYIRDKFQPEDFLYHRVGMRYVFDNGLNINLVLKSHWARADYVEYGIGYTFKR